MRTRRAIPGDEGTLRALRADALTRDPYAFGSTVERELARTAEDWRRWLSPGAVFLLEDERGARGLVAAALDRADGAAVELMAMWVEPEARGGRGADLLIADVVAWARAEGARTVRLQVVCDNARARRVYERNGFTLTHRRRIRGRDGAVECEMERGL